MYPVHAVLRPQRAWCSTSISAVDLALYDLLGRLRQEPVYAPARRRRSRRADLLRHRCAARSCAADGVRRRQAARCTTRPHEGVAGLRANLEELAAMRDKVGDDFWLMWDCWMSLDLDYADPAGHRGS